MSEELKPLTRKQERFCQEYIKDLNQTQALIRAGYDQEPGVAAVTAHRLLKKANVAQRIQQLFDERAKTVGVDANTVLRELLMLATVDLSRAYDSFGQVLPMNEMPEEIRKCIAGFEVQEIFFGQGDDKQVGGFTKKLKFWDKPKALELLGKHLKLFTDKVEHSGSFKLEDLVGGNDKGGSE